MTHSITVGRYRIIFSDESFPNKKNPTVSIYDMWENREKKVASFNNKETFNWFCAVIEGYERWKND